MYFVFRFANQVHTWVSYWNFSELLVNVNSICLVFVLQKYPLSQTASFYNNFINNFVVLRELSDAQRSYNYKAQNKRRNESKKYWKSHFVRDPEKHVQYFPIAIELSASSKKIRNVVEQQQHTGYLGYYVNYILKFAPLLNKINLKYIGLRLLNFTSLSNKVNLIYIGFFLWVTLITDTN